MSQTPLYFSTTTDIYFPSTVIQMKDEETVQAKLVGERLNDAVLKEAERIASKFGGLRSELKRKKVREDELEKMVGLHERTIEKLILQLQGKIYCIVFHCINIAGKIMII
jgi:hypothetical protein